MFEKMCCVENEEIMLYKQGKGHDSIYESQIFYSRVNKNASLVNSLPSSEIKFHYPKKDEPVKTISVNKGIPSTVDTVLKDNAGTLIEKGKESQVSQSVEIISNIEAPIKKGDVLR